MEEHSAQSTADIPKLAAAIRVGAACQKLGVSTKTVHTWRRAERLEKGELRAVQPREMPE